MPFVNTRYLHRGISAFLPVSPLFAAAFPAGSRDLQLHAFVRDAGHHTTVSTVLCAANGSNPPHGDNGGLLATFTSQALLSDNTTPRDVRFIWAGTDFTLQVGTACLFLRHRTV